MKKIILVLWLFLSLIVFAHGQHHVVETVTDTLSPMNVSGLEVIPVRMISRSFLSRGVGETTWWTLFEVDFEEHFRNFESKYHGELVLDEQTRKEYWDWTEDVWNRVVPDTLKKMKHISWWIDLYINKQGEVFSVDYIFPGEIFQELKNFPVLLKELHVNLLKEKCELVKKCEIQYYHERSRTLDGYTSPGFKHLPHTGKGKDYVIIQLRGDLYNFAGTVNCWKIEHYQDSLRREERIKYEMHKDSLEQVARQRIERWKQERKQRMDSLMRAQ